MSAEVDGERNKFRDGLLDKMVGEWIVDGTVMGQPLRHSGDAEWVLNHQFLRLHFRDASSATRKTPDPPYEALVFIGFDNMSERYVAHWLDTFGGRTSEVLGFGTKEGGRAIRFVFEGGSGPLHNVVSWDPAKKTWRMLIRQKNERGKWRTFADETFHRV